MFICAVFDAAGDVGEKLVGDVRYDYPDGVRLAAAKRACRIVGLVVKLFGDLQNPLRRLFVDAVGALAAALLFMTNDTSAIETPASVAMSFMVTLRVRIFFAIFCDIPEILLPLQR